MSKLFDMTNPFWSFVGKLLDVVVLHILWAICCLPVVTFGASTTALFYVMMKEASDRGSHYYRMFFKAFKDNLFKGSIIGLVFLVLEGGLIYAFYLTTVNIDLNPAFPGIRIVSIIFGVLVFVTFMYAFPLQARFENSVPRTILNGLMFSVRHLGATIVMTAIFAGVNFLLIYFIQYVFPLYLWGFGLIVFVCSFILNHILEPYAEMAAKHGGMVSTDPDKWKEEATEETEGDKNTEITGITETAEATQPAGEVHTEEKNS